MQERIEKAGIRLAGLLNELFKDGLAGSAALQSKPVTDNGNKTTTICDKVYSSKVMEGSQMTLLNLGGAYPNQKLTIVIKGQDRSKFSKAPEELYKDKHICVTGIPTSFKGKDEIIVSEPSQIEVK